MKPLSIGETTTYKGVELVCVKWVNCESCAFWTQEYCPDFESGLVCLKHCRPDGKSVHFEVKEGK